MTTSRAGPARIVLATVAVMLAVALAARFGPRHAMLIVGPLGAALLVAFGWAAGLTADEMGLGRRSWRRGAAYGALCVAAVATGYAVAVLVPAIRPAFLDERYRVGVAAAVLHAFVWVPLGTVLFEEVAFRGVLWGVVRSSRGSPAAATAVSSALFGLWHVLPSLRLHEVNPAVGGLVGPGPLGRALAVGGAVVFTALAGVLLCELRRRSGSLLAPIGLHWAVNGIGLLVSAGVAR
jgi:membrane protease YdiL (CAAX protease family)